MSKINRYIMPGLEHLCTLSGHNSEIGDIAWSRDNDILAAGFSDGAINIWDGIKGKKIRRIEGHANSIRSIALSANGRVLASGTTSGNIGFWDPTNGMLLNRFEGHERSIRSLALSTDGSILASGSGDKTIGIWNSPTAYLQFRLVGHSDWVTCISLSEDGNILASGSDDNSVSIWHVKSGKHLRKLEGHTAPIHSIAISSNGNLLASGADDATIGIWDIATGNLICQLPGHDDGVHSVSWSMKSNVLASASIDQAIILWNLINPLQPTSVKLELLTYQLPLLAFHPTLPILAIGDYKSSKLDIYAIDFDILFKSAGVTYSEIPVVPPFASRQLPQYTNAKIVLVGDSGVGKSGLGLVLSGQSYKETDSTHARRVWTFQSQEVELENGLREQREALLWDLAGQPSYRLIHQLHLNEVAVALVVFDARSETDPFAGVRHWDRALRQARDMQGSSACPMQKFLVAARTDRGGIGVSRERIDKLMQDMGFSEYFETSAREGWSVEELRRAVQNAIAWDEYPKVTSTQLFQKIKEFLVAEKEAGHLLSTVEDLYRTYRKSLESGEDTKELRAQFETCIGRVESRDLIKRLSFGNLVLLQPEMLDAYASALVNAAKEEPDGLGCIAEEDARMGRFKLSEDERLKDKEQEKLLLIATVESLLSHDIALREQADDGPQIIFPSHFTRENPDLPDPEGKAVIFTFEGPVVNIYATLAVRLSYSGLFKKREMWKNAATFDASVGGTCGLFVREIEEGSGELTLFFETEANEQTRYQFEEYIHAHLKRRALPETIKRRRIFVCPECDTPVSDLAATKRKERGFDSMNCNVCDANIPLLDREKRLAIQTISVIQKMDEAADKQRNRETAISIVEGKLATKDYDVFLCHNSKDKPAIIKIGEQLKEQGLLPWMDIWELRPGLPWQEALEEVIGKVKSAAVFVGQDGIGPWQNMEQAAFLREFVGRKCPVIPVLLPNAPKEPELPRFLLGMTWVDFRKPDSDPLSNLIWGITGENPHHGKFKR